MWRSRQLIILIKLWMSLCASFIIIPLLFILLESAFTGASKTKFCGIRLIYIQRVFSKWRCNRILKIITAVVNNDAVCCSTHKCDLFISQSEISEVCAMANGELKWCLSSRWLLKSAAPVTLCGAYLISVPVRASTNPVIVRKLEDRTDSC